MMSITRRSITGFGSIYGHLLGLGCASTICLSVTCLAGDTTTSGADTWSTEAYVQGGVIHDTHLVVPSLDQEATAKDQGYRTQVMAKLTWRPTAKWRINGGYQWLFTDYDQRNDYDQRLDLVSLAVHYQAGIGDLGISHYQARSQLDDSHLLDFTQSTGDWGHSWGQHTYSRLSISQRRKDFAELKERSAESLGQGLDIYWFPRPADSVSIGVSHWDEDAKGAAYDYRAWVINASARHRFQGLGHTQHWVVKANVEDRDYRHALAGAGKRDDQILRLSVALEVNLTPHLLLIPALDYTAANSPLDSADYQQQLWSVALRWTL